MTHEQTLQAIVQFVLNQHPPLLANLPIQTLPLTEQTSIKFSGNFNHHPLSMAIWRAMQKALALEHTLPEWITLMPGMSGKKYRFFINNLVKEVSNPRYFEIGSWAGSTAASAISNNALSALCVDNWSEFGGPKASFMENIARAKSNQCEFRFLERDYRTIDYGLLNFDANIYLYDGPHEEQDQYDGISFAIPALQNDFILIVDDYNWQTARNGTMRAISDNGLAVQSCVEIRTTTNNTHPKIQMQNSDWHNGYFIAHIKKQLE